MSVPLVKLCGFSAPEMVAHALAVGADLVGFVCYPPSPRHVSPQRMGELIEAMGAHASRSVAVLVNPNDALLDAIATYAKPAALQLHGDETPERLAEIRTRWPQFSLIKALRIAEAADVAQAKLFEPVADMLLFDAKAPQGALPGGTGHSFDWQLLAGRQAQKPVLLSGGISVENMADALRISGAAGVDASSALEHAPGVKDTQKISDFVAALHAIKKD